jgi:hypothetical protein
VGLPAGVELRGRSGSNFGPNLIAALAGAVGYRLNDGTAMASGSVGDAKSYN